MKELLCISFRTLSLTRMRCNASLCSPVIPWLCLSVFVGWTPKTMSWKRKKMLHRAEGIWWLFSVGLLLWATPFTLHIVIWASVSIKRIDKSSFKNFHQCDFTSLYPTRTFRVGTRKNLSTQWLPTWAHSPCRHADAPPPHHRYHQDGRNEGPRLSQQPCWFSLLSSPWGLTYRPISY